MQPDRLLPIEPHLLRRALLPGAGSVPHDVRTSFHLPRSQSQQTTTNALNNLKNQLTPLPLPTAQPTSSGATTSAPQATPPPSAAITLALCGLPWHASSYPPSSSAPAAPLPGAKAVHTAAAGPADEASWDGERRVRGTGAVLLIRRGRGGLVGIVIKYPRPPGPSEKRGNCKISLVYPD